MEIRIDGKLYDTGKAKLIGEYRFPHETNKPHTAYTEALYRKRTGEFFLYGKGEATSKYAQYAGNNMWCPGEKILPLTLEQATSWSKEYLSDEVYRSAFEIAAEAEDKRQALCLNVSCATVKQLKKMAAREGKSMSAIVEQLVKEALSK